MSAPSPKSKTPSRSHASLITKTGITSGVTAAAEYVLYVTLVELASLLYLYSAVCAGIFGIFFNFALNRIFVFRDTQGRVGGQLLKFAIVTGIGIGSSFSLLYLMVDLIGIPYWIAWGIANLTVFLVWTYPTNRYIVFPESRAQPAPEPAQD